MKTVAVVLALTLVGGCGVSDPEAQIRTLLAAAEEAAEERDMGFFGDLIGESYRDARGNDRDELLRMVRGHFIANQRVEIVSRVDEVELQGVDAARVVLHAGTLGQRTGAEALAGMSADLYRVELELTAAGGDWQIIGARWSRALGE